MAIALARSPALNHTTGAGSSIFWVKLLATSPTGPHSHPLTDVHEDRRSYALVVDDDELLRMDVCEILEQAGFRTLKADTGHGAMAVLEQRHLDVSLMFSDVEMPGLRNGFALAREVAVKWPHIANVIASGQMRPGRDELSEGACFLGKPFSAEMVHGHLRKILPGGQKPEPLRGMP